MKKSVWKKVHGARRQWKRTSWKHSRYVWREYCPSGRYCDYCADSRQASGKRNLERAEDMLDELSHP